MIFRGRYVVGSFGKNYVRVDNIGWLIGSAGTSLHELSCKADVLEKHHDNIKPAYYANGYAYYKAEDVEVPQTGLKNITVIGENQYTTYYSGFNIYGQPLTRTFKKKVGEYSGKES